MENELINLEVLKLLVSGLGGGLIATLVTLMTTEFWSNKRERRQFFYGFLHRFFSNYHLYIRLLRSETVDAERLNVVHAAYLSDVKLLGTFSEFSEDAESFKSIGKKMANIKINFDTDDHIRGEKLEEVFEQFGDTVTRLVNKI